MLNYYFSKNITYMWCPKEKEKYCRNKTLSTTYVYMKYVFQLWNNCKIYGSINSSGMIIKSEIYKYAFSVGDSCAYRASEGY